MVFRLRPFLVLFLFSAVLLSAGTSAREVILLDFKKSPLKKLSKVNDARWNAWLARYVKKNGHVNYRAGRKKIGQIQKYIEYLLSVAPASLRGRSSRLAYHLNLYNSLIVYGVLRYYPIKSVRKIKGVSFFDLKFFYKGKKISIDQLEKEIIMPRFKEPLVHFALNCASYSCPPLRNKAYTGRGLKKQLIRQTKAYLKNTNFVRVDHKQKKLQMIELFKWYRSDLGDPKKFYKRYTGSATNVSGFSLEFITYDWSLNGI